MNELLSLIAGKLIDFLPPLVLRRLLSPQKVGAQIKLGLREARAIVLSLGSPVPEITVYFEISNFGSLSLVLERLLIEVWFGQPTLTGAILKRTPVMRSKLTTGIFFKSDLTAAQCKQIQDFLTAQGSSGRIMLHLMAYFESKVGIVEVKRDIERNSI